MSYLPALFGTIAAYVLLAVLLLSLNIASLWRWWVKLGAIVLTTGAFIFTYLAITGLVGWPSPQPMPDRFSLLSTRIIEPDKVTGAPGRLYMWVERIDENNLPISQPRNHEVAYTAEMAEKLNGAQDLLDAGQEVLGEMLAQPQGQEAEAATNASDNPDGRPDGGNDETDTARTGGSSQQGGPAGEGYLLDVTESLQLSDMPPPELPDKGPL